MKQRISVRAILKQNEKTLLVRRANGRDSIIGKYELPGGKVAYGEQPEDSLRRYLLEDTGLHLETAQLFDAVTYIDKDDRDIQYAVVVYIVANNSSSVKLSQNYDKYEWKRQSDVRQDTITDLTQLLLGIMQQEVIIGPVVNSVSAASGAQATIFSDGGSRGNPGPSAAGFVVIGANQEVLAQGGEYLGITTNSQAEYHGVRLGLEAALSHGLRRVDFCIDSMLVVNQMNGLYKIKNRELWPIHERIRELMAHFDKVIFSHVPRERNQLADGIVNKTLDAHVPSERYSI